jgi:serine phosphatase RsbU (regulator of sigma subunit)
MAGNHDNTNTVQKLEFSLLRKDNQIQQLESELQLVSIEAERARIALKARLEELEKRTVELHQRNKELSASYQQALHQKAEMEAHIAVLEAQNKALAKDKDHLIELERELKVHNAGYELANKKITDSITYAKRIQEALLPHQEVLTDKIPASFIYWQPKDIVSGDFYWFCEKNYKLVIVAADCTGHGVPGAFMSSIGMRALHEAVVYKCITEPAEILADIDSSISHMLYQPNKVNRDGMDMVICVVDNYPTEFQREMGPRKVKFAGARNPLVYTHQGEVHRIKGDKKSVGEPGDFSYTQHEIILDGTMNFYLFSDGFQDQFGGEGRKYSLRGLESYIQQIQHSPMHLQGNLLMEEYVSWKKREIQIDDILVMGFQLQADKS